MDGYGSHLGSFKVLGTRTGKDLLHLSPESVTHKTGLYGPEST